MLRSVPNFVVLLTLGGELWCGAASAADPPAVDPAWLHLYVRNRRQSVALEAAGELAASGRIPESLSQLQWLLDQPHDAWTISPAGKLTSIRAATEELLTSQPPAVLDQYRRLQGPAAAQELARAVADPETASLVSLVKRFAATEAGGQAAEMLLARWLDEGAWRRAAALGWELVESRPAPSADLLRRTWLACHLAGRSEEAALLEPRLASAGLAPLPGAAAAETPTEQGALRWLGPGGDGQRTARALTATAPVLEPLWQQPLVSAEQTPNAADAVARWLAAQREQDQPAAIGWTPVLAGDQLVFRSLDSILSVDVKTGALRWRYRTRTGLGSLLSPATEETAPFRRNEPSRSEAALANSLLGGVSTDGRRVYALDEADAFVQSLTPGLLEQRELNAVSRRAAARNALVALALGDLPESDRVVWSTATSDDRDRWAHHAFLGPPLPAEGWLYVLSETDREICLSALEAESGRLIWQQPVAEVELSVVQDRARGLRACLPTLADGLVLCPTHVGLLVAVDALTGQLRWVHSALNLDDQDGRFSRFRPAMPQLRQHRHPGFAPLVHVQGQRAVYLPSHAQRLYCLTASTGQVEWTAEIAKEQPDAEYIGAVTETTVLVVGRSVCRGLSLTDGSEQWKRPLSSVPGGFGVARSASYLLPVSDGGVVELDLATGAPRGYHFQSVAAPLGHLVATSDAILSVGAAGVAAYPQAAAVRQRLQWEQLHEPTDPVRDLALASVQLTEGELAKAIAGLERCLPQLPAGPSRERGELLLRKSYFQAIANDEAAVDVYLARLKPLCTSPQDQWRWQVTASDRAVDQGNHAVALALVSEILQSSPKSVTPTPADPALSVSPRAWLRQLCDRDADRGEFRRAVLAAAQDRLGAEAVAAAFVLDGDGWAAASRLEQARAARGRGDWHQAECLLLRDAGGTDVAAADACLELVRLYEAAGLLTLAGQRLEELATRLGALRSQEGSSYAELVADWPKSSGAWAGWKRRQPLEQPIRRIALTVQSIDDAPGELAPGGASGWAAAADRYAGFQRAVLPPRPEAAVEWLTQSRDRHMVFGVFDRCSSLQMAEYPLPFGVQSPVLPQEAGLGLAFGLSAELRMLSPLQGMTDGVAWSATLPEWRGRSGQPLSGPSTPRFVLMQLKNELAAVDAADGTVLWSRSDLPSGSGLQADARSGLSVDDEYVVVLENGKQTYRVLSAHTGQVIRQGSSPMGPGRLSPARGRLVCYKSTDGLTRLKVWDPATDTFLLEAVQRSRPLLDESHSDRVAWVTPNYRLCIFDYGARKTVVDVPISERDVDRATTLRCFEQGGRYFAALGGDQPTARMEHFHNPLSESLVPAVTVRDELLAIDPASQEILWQRSQASCSMVQWGQLPVPVLVALSSVRDRRNPNHRWLRIETMDPATGLRIGESEPLPLDSLLSADYDGAAGTIRLLGRQTSYELKLHPGPAELEPFGRGW